MELSREEKIRDDVNTHLVWDNRIDAKDIRVEVVGSRVILIGTVPSYSDRWQAEDDAYSIPGVRSVDNRLKVVPAVSP
ncbi:MAG TPA: BON domain-containing protein, partial [Deltaproteobacteria bacterium]|nr:BON domain-containing protein [Deltaproteobacteria bacterium]